MIGIIVDIKNKKAIMTTPNMPDTSVSLLKYLPYGLSIGDKPHVPDILFFMKKDWIEESIPNCDFMLEAMEIKWKNNPPDIEWITEWLKTKMPDPIYEVVLLVPYYYIDTNIYFTPKKSVDNINLNIVIDNES